MKIREVARVLTFVFICVGIILKIQDIEYAYLVLAVGVIISLFIDNRRFIKNEKS